MDPSDLGMQSLTASTAVMLAVTSGACPPSPDSPCQWVWVWCIDTGTVSLIHLAWQHTPHHSAQAADHWSVSGNTGGNDQLGKRRHIGGSCEGAWAKLCRPKEQVLSHMVVAAGLMVRGYSG